MVSNCVQRPVGTSSRWYLIFALLYSLMTVYGSLVPFHFRPVPLPQAINQFQGVLKQPIRIGSRSDWAANVLLFVPCGFLWMGFAGSRGSRWSLLWKPILVLAFCVLLAMGLEFAQIFTTGSETVPGGRPPRGRVPSVTDIVALSIGAVVGIGLWLGISPFLSRWSQSISQAKQKQDIAVQLFPIYLLCLVVVSLSPFDLTISPVELYRKFRDGGVVAIPFTARFGDWWEAVHNYAWTVGYFLPVGLFASMLHGSFWQEHKNWWKILGLGLLLAMFIEGLHIFVMGRRVDSTDVILGGAAVVGGWLLALGLREGQPNRYYRTPWGEHITLRHTARGAPHSPVLWAMLIIGWLGLVVVQTWRPFQFHFEGEMAWRRFEQMPMLPFYEYFRGNFLNAADQFIQKSLVFAPLGVFVALLAAPDFSLRATVLMVILSIVVATILEAGQLFLPGRYPSFSDILVQTFGALGGYFLARRVILIQKKA